eukprot:5288764-Pyramimonas_sp.AAC.1
MPTPVDRARLDRIAPNKIVGGPGRRVGSSLLLLHPLVLLRPRGPAVSVRSVSPPVLALVLQARTSR